MEVFSGEVYAYLVYACLLCHFCGNGVSYGEIFQTQVAGVLQVSVVGIAQVSAGRHIGARAYEVCVGIVLSPYIVEEIGRNEGVVGISVCTPEGHRLVFGIPIVVAGALEEYRDVESEVSYAACDAI